MEKEIRTELGYLNSGDVFGRLVPQRMILDSLAELYERVGKIEDSLSALQQRVYTSLPYPEGSEPEWETGPFWPSVGVGAIEPGPYGDEKERIETADKDGPTDAQDRKLLLDLPDGVFGWHTPDNNVVTVRVESGWELIETAAEDGSTPAHPDFRIREMRD